jgi:hypothetical protein
MRFLDNLQAVAAVFVKAKLRRDRNNSRDAGLEFEMVLPPEVIRALPAAMQKTVKLVGEASGPVYAELDEAVKHRTVEFFGLPDGANLVCAVHNVTISGFKVKRQDVGTARSTVLLFAIDVPLNNITWPFIGEFFGNQVWLRFSPTQKELIESDDEASSGASPEA